MIGDHISLCEKEGQEQVMEGSLGRSGSTVFLRLDSAPRLLREDLWPTLDWLSRRRLDGNGIHKQDQAKGVLSPNMK